MTPEEAKNYIISRGVFGSILGLSTIGKLVAELGHPEKGLRFIHIAGTNGKGSTAHMTAEILTAAGYHVGLYTSPALESFNERIRLDGAPITDALLAEQTSRVKTAAEQIVSEGAPEPTGFEIETALAFCIFETKKIDFAVIEVGMGGRLDATNIIPPAAVSVITRIGYDHTQYLGDTLAEIAGEKAAIIKPGTTVVMAPQEKEAADVIRSRAAALGAALFDASQIDLVIADYDLNHQHIVCRADALPDLKEFDLALKGSHQLENTAAALGVVVCLRRQGAAISNDAIKTALSHIVFHGRFELLNKNPLVLIDGAHNANGIAAFVKNLKQYFPDHKVNLYFGMLADKDIDKSLGLLIPAATWVHTLTPDSDRALSAKGMAKKIHARFNIPVDDFDNIQNALATLNASNNVVNVFVGSLYLIGHVRTAFFHQFNQ